MKVIIIGGTGLIGPCVTQEIMLGYPDADIFVVNRTGSAFFSAKSIACDRNDETVMRKIFNDIRPDVVIDMIPFTAEDAEKSASIISGLKNTVQTIVMSSIDVYAAYAKIHGNDSSDYQSCPITEEMALRVNYGPEGAAYDKLSVERIYSNTVKNVTILRLPAVYGWPDKRRIATYLEPMLNGDNVIKIPKARQNWRFSRCYHRNAAYAVFKCINQPSETHGIYNIAESTAYSDYQWCRELARNCGWRGLIVLTEEPVDVDLKQDFYVSTSKIRQCLGYTEKYNPQYALADTVKWYSYDRMSTSYSPCY